MTVGVDSVQGLDMIHDTYHSNYSITMIWYVVVVVVVVDSRGVPYAKFRSGGGSWGNWIALGSAVVPVSPSYWYHIIIPTVCMQAGTTLYMQAGTRQNEAWCYSYASVHQQYCEMNSRLQLITETKTKNYRLITSSLYWNILSNFYVCGTGSSAILLSSTSASEGIGAIQEWPKQKM